MLREVKWIAGALAATLYALPVAAQSGSSTQQDSGAATGSGATSSQGAASSDTAATPAQSTDSAEKANQPAGRTSDTAQQAQGTASSAADTAGKKAGAMGQQATSDTARTLAKLHTGNEMEVEAGTWMREHAMNDKVKDFAKKMVVDHSAMDKDAMDWAQKHNIDLTSAPKPADVEKGEHHAKLDELKNMSGAQADRAYMKMMVEDHTKDVREVRDAEQHAKRGANKSDKDFASFLDKSAKKMESHLKDAQKIQRDLATQRQARTPSGQ
ncbi:MAG TPA: DUF4142 domain-containing protein [Anaeromyxobacteraceae bacterium]